MKLAEALIERKAVKTRMEELKQRIHRNAQVQEGLEPVEDPTALLLELRQEVHRFEALVTRINRTNAQTALPTGGTLGEAILRKDMLRYLQLILSNLADKATPVQERYSQREVKHVPAVDIAEIRRQAEEAGREHRRLDAVVQALNWQVDLF